MSASTSPQATPVAVVGDRCGEGAVWSPEEQAVYWTDINRFLVHRLTWPDRQLSTWQFDEPPTALALSTERGRLLVALASQLVWWWPAQDRRAPHGFELPGHPTVRLNDGRADPLGNFWVGSMYNNVAAHGGPTDEHRATGNGVLFRVAPDGQVTETVRGIGIANTLCWSPDRTAFYSADTMKNEIRRYRYDAKTGDISGETVHFAGYERGSPDGSAMDAEGHIWNARWGGGGLVRIAPDGKVDGFYPVPTTNITTCTFGGPDLTTLFVTSARNDADPGDRLAGSLWAMEVGVKGAPDYRVRVPSAA
jgi:sugar lactone lactonase YvrE